MGAFLKLSESILRSLEGVGSTSTMEARYVEAGSMTIFWTQNRALKTTSLARVPIRT